MSKKYAFIFLSIIAFAGCKKSSESAEQNDYSLQEVQVINDFTNKVALPGYSDLKVTADAMNASIIKLNANPTEANLDEARSLWKNMRSIWEQCEGFLFGPVEDDNYDPNMDTWPTDYTQMDSLLASNNSLSTSEIQNLTLSLRGYHPIEYILFGHHGDRRAADLTQRQKDYITSLSADLVTTCTKLQQSWTAQPTNFSQEVLNAAKGSTRFTTRRQLLTAMVDGLIDIAGEVAEGKMKEPFVASDPSIVESPYSGNSLTDFKNNIIGLQNVYLGRYHEDGAGINDLVKARNAALDNKIQDQMNAAIASFSSIRGYYEAAIISERTAVQNTMNAISTLKETLENELKPFIAQNIKD